MTVHWTTAGSTPHGMVNLVQRSALPLQFVPPALGSNIYLVLQNLLHGGGTVYITYDEDDEREFAQIIAEEKFRELGTDRWVRSHYISVDAPEYDESLCDGKPGWFIGVYLTQRGHAALATISDNLIWNAVEHRIDESATEAWFRQYYLDRGRLPDEIAQVIKGLPQPRFTALITDMIAFILGCDHEGACYTRIR